MHFEIGKPVKIETRDQVSWIALSPMILRHLYLIKKLLQKNETSQEQISLREFFSLKKIFKKLEILMKEIQKQKNLNSISQFPYDLYFKRLLDLERSLAIDINTSYLRYEEISNIDVASLDCDLKNIRPLLLKEIAYFFIISFKEEGDSLEILAKEDELTAYLLIEHRQKYPSINECKTYLSLLHCFA